MRFQLFYETDSFLHRVNPLSKLVLTVVVMVLLTVVVDPITPLTVTLIGIPAIVLLGRVPLGQTLKTLRPFGIVSFGLFWTTALFYASAVQPIFVWGPIALTKAGMAYGAVIMLRILAITGRVAPSQERNRGQAAVPRQRSRGRKPARE